MMNFDIGGRVVGVNGDAFGFYDRLMAKAGPKRGRERQVWLARRSNCGARDASHQAMATPSCRP